MKDPLKTMWKCSKVREYAVLLFSLWGYRRMRNWTYLVTLVSLAILIMMFSGIAGDETPYPRWLGYFTGVYYFCTRERRKRE